MAKRIDPDSTVADLTEQYPELVDALADLGFLGVRSEATRRSVGRLITLRRGCGIQGKRLEDVAQALGLKGFVVENVRRGLADR
jgi:hypothetical protein